MPILKKEEIYQINNITFQHKNLEKEEKKKKQSKQNEGKADNIKIRREAGLLPH